jgi:hypothetical protein
MSHELHASKLHIQEKGPVPIGRETGRKGVPEPSGRMKTKGQNPAVSPYQLMPGTDVFCNCVLSATVEVATHVGAMVTYFCQESVHQMTAQQG